MWIEELIGRRDSLRPDEVIAVSSSGFTDPALTKARAKGIQAWTLLPARLEELVFAISPPELFFAVIKDIDITVNLYVPLSAPWKIRKQIEEEGYGILDWGFKESIGHLSSISELGLFSEPPQALRHSLERNVQVAGMKIRSSIQIESVRDWISIEPRSRKLVQKRSGELCINAEVHGGAFEGAHLDLVLTKEIWAVTFDLRRLQLPRGTLVMPACAFGNPELGGKEVKFQFLDAPERKVTAPIRYLVQPGF